VSIEDIRQLKHAAPFNPFNIVMKDGRVLWVGEPLSIALSPTGKTVAVAHGSTFSFLIVDRIAKIEPNARPRLRFKRN
jgi:bacteriorhodopsin